MKTDGWTCLPYAFAKAIDCGFLWFMEQIGHNGSEESYHNLPGVKCGFHQQECIEVVQKLGYACTPIEIVPQIQPFADGPIRQIWFPGGGTQEQNNRARFERHLRGTRGVLTGVVTQGNQPAIGHAVAWFGTPRLIYDSRRDIPTAYSFEDIGKYHLTPHTYWKIQRIENV